jgi:hypothetical protein
LNLFASAEASLGVAIAVLLVVLGFRLARPGSSRGWAALLGYGLAIAATLLADRGILLGPAIEAGTLLRLSGAAVLVVGLLLAGSAARARALPAADTRAGSSSHRRMFPRTAVGLALVLLGFLARSPSLAGGIAVLLDLALVAWAAWPPESG